MRSHAQTRPCGAIALFSARVAVAKEKKRRRILRLLLLKRILCFLPSLVSLTIKAVTATMRSDDGGGGAAAAAARRRALTVLVPNEAGGPDVEVFTHRALYSLGMRR